MDTSKMQAAFEIVDPSCGGKVPGRSWRDPIDTGATPETWARVCELRGVTFEDVLESIRFYTATDPTVEVDALGVRRVRADGYRKGPAGP